MFKLNSQIRELYQNENNLKTRMEMGTMGFVDRYGLKKKDMEMVLLWRDIFKAHLVRGIILDWWDMYRFYGEWFDLNGCDLFNLDYRLSLYN